MNRGIGKRIIAFMILVMAALEVSACAYAGELGEDPVNTAEIAAEPVANQVEADVVIDPEPVELPDPGVTEPPVIDNPVEPEVPEVPVTEPTAAWEPVTGASPEVPVQPTPVQTEPAQPSSASGETGTTAAGRNGYDVEGIDASELESYLYEMGMGEWADSISDGSGSDGTDGYTWGLNTLTREPAELNGYNFVIFGLSGENSGDDGRSDTIMICTIDPDRKEIKLTSILRDTKAVIEGHEPQKINAAHKIGGPALAIDTLNRNFGLTLTNYITVQFDTLMDIIDILGGIEIALTQEEADFINEYSVEYGFEPLSEGTEVLNGWQSVLYCRIRKIDSDKVRAGRQQTVIQKIFEKMKDSGFFQWLQVVMKALETSKISMPLGQIIEVISLPLSEYTLVKNVVPDIEYETDLKTAIDEHGEWVWLYDLGEAGDRIVDIINNQ